MPKCQNASLVCRFPKTVEKRPMARIEINKGKAGSGDLIEASVAESKVETEWPENCKKTSLSGADISR